MRVISIVAVFTLCFIGGSVLHVQAASGRHAVLVEAEAFDDHGGWVDDSQFMDQMGSSFLLAHGRGVPVADATTRVRLPAPGTYHVWVRTRDWVASWDAPGQPGRFKLSVDGKKLDATFGTEGAEWHWREGGAVEVQHTEVVLRLHDLTGFEGRCDAIVLTTDPAAQLPNEDPEMARWRRGLLGIPEQPEEAGQFDLVVVGGGIAGTCAALSASRLGLAVALIQDRPVLGGNNSSEIRVWLHGARNKEPYPRVGDVVRELEQSRRAHYGPKNTAEIYEDDEKLALVRAEDNVNLFLLHRANGVEMDGDRITAVIAQHTKTGVRRRFVGQWFADCTGDGCLGYLAGADYEMTETGHMGRCNLWNVVETDRPRPFPRCPWALDLSDKPFPGRNDDKRGARALGGWYWESGFDHDPFEKSEYIRDWNFRAAYGAWDALKNVDGRYPNHKLNWLAYIAGKRESRRLMGDVVLTQTDLVENKQYPDGCVPTGWNIDLHLPHPDFETGFEGDAFISRAHYTKVPRPYWIPYRCLYSRNVTNLFMAGRDISVTHQALGAVRVMRTGGCMGEIVGMAASLCKRFDGDPRDVYSQHLQALKQIMSEGVGKLPPEPEHAAASVKLAPPPWAPKLGQNVAPRAKLAAPPSLDAKQYPAEHINDEVLEPLRNDHRYLSKSPLPHEIEFVWSEAQTVAGVRIVSGYVAGVDNLLGPIQDFTIQYHDGTGWTDLSSGQVTGNEQIDWARRFQPLTTNRVRLVITRTHVDVSRIWEVEWYAAEKDED
ncbi:MAG: FAD-dependent oxidoreductase [Planctomycetota bacterium]